MPCTHQVSLPRRMARGLRRLHLRRGRVRASDPAAANAALNAAEVRHGKTRLVSTPLTIQVMTTLVCNLRCPFCRREEETYVNWMNSLPKDGWHLPWEVVEKIMTAAPHAQNISMTPLAEPTLYRHWDRLLDRAREIGLTNLTMTSNATRLPDALCEKVIRSGFRSIHFSIDSADPETFEAFRVGTTLDKVEAGLERLNGWKAKLRSPTPELLIAATFNRTNIEDLPGMVDFAARHLASTLIVQKMEFTDETLMNPADDLVHFPDVTRRMIEEGQRRAEATGVQLSVHYAMLNQIEAAHVDGTFETSASAHSAGAPTDLIDLCTHPFHYMVVDVDGDVRPCCWAAVKYGNLLEAPSFDAVWNSEVAQQMRADFLSNRLTPGCRDKHCGVSQQWERMQSARAQ